MTLKYFENTTAYNELSNEIQSSSIQDYNLIVTDQSFETIRNQFIALEIINITSNTFTTKHQLFDHNTTEIVRMWNLTEKGRKLFLSNTAIRNT